MYGDLTWGGEHTIQCTDDVLWNCAPETCVILLTSVTPIHAIKGKIKNLLCAFCCSEQCLVQFLPSKHVES